MAFCDDIVTHLKAQSAITSLVGSGTAARVLQQDGLKQSSTLPAITFRQVSEQPIEYLGGRSSLRQTTVEVMSYASTPSARNTLAGLVLAAFAAISGVATYGASTVTEVNVINSGADGDDLAVDGSDVRIYWKQQVFQFWFYV